MDSVYALHPAKVGGISASGVQWLDIFDTLLAEPRKYFDVGKHDGTGLNPDGCGIGDMVKMRVRHKNIIRFDFFDVHGFGQRVPTDERVKQQVLPIYFGG